MKIQSAQRIQTVILVMICMWLGISWIFTRYVHYHSQNRSLNPEDYEIMVVSAADYAALADPKQTTVALQDGSEITKGEKWEVSSFKALPGDTAFAKVTTKGTAHHLSRTTTDLLPPFLLALFGAVLSLLSGSRDKTKAEQAGAGNA